MRSSIGTLSGTATGVILDLTFKLVNVNNNCANLEGYAIYLWHNNALGEYSIYEIPDQNYLRAVAASGQDGTVTFKTIFPGCYEGRYPHMHFEIYRSVSDATIFTNRILTSQIAMPSNACNDVYTLSSYGQSANRFSQLSIASDGVFGDNTAAQNTAQTATLSGSNATSYVGEVTIGLAI